jgi:hypothetical protein
MEKILTIFKNFEHDNQTLCESIAHLQANQVSTSLGYVSATQP